MPGRGLRYQTGRLQAPYSREAYERHVHKKELYWATLNKVMAFLTRRCWEAAGELEASAWFYDKPLDQLHIHRAYLGVIFDGLCEAMGPRADVEGLSGS